MVIVGIVPFFTFALGTWQLKRLKWKIDLIDELEEKLQLAPLTLPGKIKYVQPVNSTFASDRNSLSVIPEFVYRRVMLKGKWDPEHAMIFTPRVREGVHGVNVVMPLVRENGSTILVDRGFVSNAHLDSSTLSQGNGLVEIIGMLRTSQKRNSFTPDNQPESGKWYWTDVEAMASYAGGEKAGVQPVFVEQIFGMCCAEGYDFG
jgi:surfeit locus 1 family protein